MTSFHRLETALENAASVPDVLTPTEYAPYKMDEYVPYDAVIPLYGDDWGESRVISLLEEFDVPYEEVISVDENDDQTIAGDRLAFVAVGDS